MGLGGGLEFWGRKKRWRVAGGGLCNVCFCVCVRGEPAGSERGVVFVCVVVCACGSIDE